MAEEGAAAETGISASGSENIDVRGEKTNTMSARAQGGLIPCDRWEWCQLIASEHGPAEIPTRLLLLVLAMYMSPAGDSAFPSQTTLARRAGMAERTVRNHLDLAEAAGWIRRCEKRRPGQSWYVHSYVATIPARLENIQPEKPWVAEPTWKRPERTDA
jgi:hypothetical protein